MADPQDIFAKALRLEDSLDQTAVPRQRPAIPAPPASPFSQALTPQQDIEGMDAAIKAGQARAYQRQLDTYTGLKKLAEIKYRGNPAGLEEEIQKIQISMYLGQQLTVDPETVYRGWNSLGENPYATQYFESKELPKTYWGYMKEDIEIAAKQYQALNMATGLFATPYRDGKYDKLIELAKSIPESTRPANRRIGQGGIGDWIKSIPSAIVSQASFLAEMGLAGLVGGSVGGLIGGAIGGPPAAAAGATLGRQSMAFLASARLGAASIFWDAMTLPVPDPNDPTKSKPLILSVKDPRELEDVARWSAAIWGGIEGAIGMVQFESLIGQGVLRKAATDSLAKGTVRNLLAESLKKYGKNVLFQTGSEPVQEIMELIGQDIVAANMNTKQGMNLPRATARDFAKLAAATADVTFRSSLLFTLPGSVIEARASIAEKIAAWDRTNAEKRIQNINRLTDVSRPFTERVVDIEARIEELRKNQADLEKRILTMSDGQFDEASVRAHDVNKGEIDYLEWIKKEEQAKDPSKPYMMTRDEAEAAAAARNAAEPSALPVAPERPQVEPAVLRGSLTTEFRGLTAEQITPEVERRMKDALYVNPDGMPIRTADELGQNQSLLITGGVAGAAKTTVVNQTSLVRENRVVVNIDTYEEMTGLTDKAWHEESRRITNEQLKEAVDRGYHVTYDSPMTDFSKIDGLIQQTLENGGPVQIAYSWIDPDTSRARNTLRTLQMEERGETIRNVDLEGTAKGWNRSTPTLVELYKKYKDNPLVRFTIQNNNVDLAEPKMIMRNNVVQDQAALDEILKTEYVKERGEKGETYYTRTERTAETAESLQSREDDAIHRGNRLRDSLRKPVETGDQGGAGLPKPQGTDQLTAFSSPDLSPTSPVVSTIREGLPNLTSEQAQGAALYAKLLASHVGMTLEDYVRSRFVKGIFSTEREKEIEAIGKHGGIDWNAAGKVIFYTTTKSDFGTWVHELTHLFEYDLDEKERASVYTWLGATDQLTEDQRERFAYSAIDYMRKGFLPREDLRPAFDRFTRWLNQIYNADLDWKISPEIVQMYNEALADQVRQPKTHGVDESVMVFETRPEVQQQDPATLKPEDLRLLTEYDRSIRDVYVDPSTGLVRPGISSLTMPMPPMDLTVGQWMIDDGCKGSHGREVAQLRQLDPNTLEVSEHLVEENIQNRGEDAKRYAAWMQMGMTPPPISVVETDAGNFRVVDGHRRTAAAIQAGRPILAWVWPTMDHPDPEAVEFYTKKRIKVGMTYEQMTGLVWPGDEKPETVEETRRQMSYETRPGDKDPWILKSRDVVRQKMRGPQPASAIRAMLEAGGVKAEEMEWLGLNDYLKGNAKLKPEEVLNYIEANAIKITEIIHQPIPADVLAATVEQQKKALVREEVDRLTEEMNSAKPNLAWVWPTMDHPEAEVPLEIRPTTYEETGETEYALVNTDSNETEESFNTEEEAQDRLKELQEKAYDAWRDEIYSQAYNRVNRWPSGYLEESAREELHKKGFGEPKFENYSLPGGKNYRELLITLPLKERIPATFKEFREGMAEEAGPGAAINRANLQEQYQEYLKEFSKGKRTGTEGFKSPHWEEPNVLVHARFTERTDTDGKRVLFIEEIQSDWHQEGRREGYVPSQAADRTMYQIVWVRGEQIGSPATMGYSETREKAEKIWESLPDNYKSGTEVREQVLTAKEYQHAVGNLVPNAPFKETQAWTALAMKRMIRWAAENNFDRIEWTTGQQQADRYSLEKFVQTVIYRPDEQSLIAFGDLPDVEGKHVTAPVLDEKVAPEDIADYIGKEAALKLLAQPLKRNARFDLPDGWSIRKQGDFWDIRDDQGKTKGFEPGDLNIKEAVTQAVSDLPNIPWKRTENAGSLMYRELTGEQLKVGGEGMKVYYDGILRDVARKLGKKFGAEVGVANLKAAKADDAAYRSALTQVMGADDRNSEIAGMLLGYMEDNECSYAESLEGAKDADIATPEEIKDLENTTALQMVLHGEQIGYQVHRLEVTQAMKDSALEGQMLFEPGPHEESVRQAVEQGLPVPDRVLEEYIDREWAQTESDRRLQLAEAARTFSNFEDFLDWQARSSPEGFPNRAYYEAIWQRSQSTNPAPAIQNRNFREAIQDDETINYIVGGFAMVHEEDLASQRVITPEMQALGRLLIQNLPPGDLTQTVRTQFENDPTRWIRFFDKYLPDDVKEDLKTAMLASQEDFVPVLPKVANERFTRNLQREGQLEDFLITVGPYRLEGKSKLLSNLAERLRNESDYIPDAVERFRAMKEIRRSITTYRELLAISTNDESMMRQLYAEAEIAVETEEERLKTENQRLRSEMKKAQVLVHDVTLKQLWTMKDLENEQKERSALKARYDQDISEAKAKLKMSMQEMRRELMGNTRLTAEVKNTMWKKRMAELKVRNEADLAVLKARVNQVRELGRQRLQAEKDKARIRFYAESINRPVNAGIADTEARLIEDIQARIAYDPEDVPDTVRNKLREWRRRNPSSPMPSDLVKKIEATNPRLITAGDMAKLYEEVKGLRNAGRKRRMLALLTERTYIQGEVKAVSGSIQGKQTPRNLRGYGTKGTLSATKSAPAKVALWATWRMNRIAEMLDGGRPGPTTNWLWDQVNDKTDESIRMVDAYSKENQTRLEELRIRARDLGKQETIDGLTITHGQMIGVYVYSQFEDGLFALKEDNRIPEHTIDTIIKALTNEEKEYGDWMIDRLSTDTDFDRLQQVQLDVSNTRMDRLRRYFPMQRQGLSGNPLMSELARELLDMAGKTNKPRPRAGFLKSRMERVEGVSFPPLRLDAPAIYMDHISKREFYIANAQLIKRLNRIFDSKEVKASMADRYGDKMQPLVQKYVAQYSNPNIYRAFEDYGEFARILRGNIGMSLIGSNVVTMLKQIPDIPQIMLMAGPVDGIRAAAQFISNPLQTLRQMWEKAPQLKARSYDRFIEELKSFDRNKYERVVRTVGEAGFAVLKAMDTATNVIGWTAVYNKTMRRTGNENLAVKAARDFILRKRPAARAKDVAAIYRSPGLSWFLMFSNQQNQQWNILTYDIPHSIREGLRGNGGAMVDAALNVTGLLVGAVGMGLIARKGVMKGSDLLEDFLNMLFGNTPFIGNAIEAAIRGQPAQDALNPFAGAYQLGKIGFDVANHADTEKVMRDLQNALFTLAGTAGFPVVQARRIYKTMQSGDPWDLIGGPPKKED